MAPFPLQLCSCSKRSIQSDRGQESSSSWQPAQTLTCRPTSLPCPLVRGLERRRRRRPVTLLTRLMSPRLAGLGFVRAGPPNNRRLSTLVERVAWCGLIANYSDWHVLDTFLSPSCCIVTRLRVPAATAYLTLYFKLYSVNIYSVNNILYDRLHSLLRWANE